PHAGLAAEDEGFLIWRKSGRCTIEGIDGVVTVCGPAQVHVIAVGKNAAIALLGSGSEGLGTTPRLDNDVFGDAWDENFVPADDGLAVLDDDFLNALTKVSLQSFVVGKFVGFFEFLNFWIGVPLLTVDLVAAHVEILIGKEFRHFGDELFQELVGF